MAQKNVEYVVGLRDKFSQKMTRMDKTTNRFNKSIGGTIARFATFAAVGGILVNATKKIADFEEQVSNLSAITGATGKDLDFLKRKAIEMGKATTKSSIDTIKAFKLIASAKPELLENASALADVTKEAIVLSEASGLDLPAAAEALTDSLNQFNLSADQSSRVINILAAGSKFAAAEIPDLTTSLKEFGGVAESLNISIEESAAAVETLSSKGLKGARAGINLRNVFLKLGSATDRRLNPKIVGLSKALENLSEIENDTTALTKMFGRQNVLAAQTLIKQRKRVDELTVALTGTNIAYEQAQINVDNLNSDVKKLSSAWEGLVLNLNKGEGGISNFFRSLTQGATGFLERLDMANKSIAQIKKSVLEESLSEAVIGDIKEFEGYIQRLNISKDNIDELTRASEKFLKVDQDRLNQMMASELARTFDKDQIDLLKNRIAAIRGFVESQGKKITTDGVIDGLLKETGTKISTKITAATPKIFNININNLVETFNVNTSTIKEGAVDIRKAIEQTLAEALADVQAIAG